MSGSHVALIHELWSAVQGDAFWENYLNHLLPTKDPVQFNLHLAVLVEPYLQYILDGRKTIESRFSANRCAPYNSVKEGDVILLKRSGGPIVGICQITSAWFYHLEPKSWKFIKEHFTQALCAQDPAFWKDREHASFATLMRIENVRAIPPISFPKKDRRGWVVLQTAPSNEQLRLNLNNSTRTQRVLAFAGSIGSGKSTLSQSVAQVLEWTYCSFGDYVRAIAQERGLNSNRETLQDIGAELTAQGWEQFCRSVLEFSNWQPGQPLIVDGVRHLEILETLQNLVSPLETSLIFISVAPSVRLTRLQQRDNLSQDEIQLGKLEAHSTEVQVKGSIAETAELVLDGTKPTERLVHQVLNHFSLPLKVLAE